MCSEIKQDLDFPVLCNSQNCITNVCLFGQMLLNLNKRSWMDSLAVHNYTEHCRSNNDSMQNVLKLAKAYNKVTLNVIQKCVILFRANLQSLEEEEKMTREQLAIKNVGKQDPKRHLEETVDEMVNSNIVQGLASTICVDAFK